MQINQMLLCCNNNLTVTIFVLINQLKKSTVIFTKSVVTNFYQAGVSSSAEVFQAEEGEPSPS